MLKTKYYPHNGCLTLKYFQTGTDPRFLFLSGLHGDEYKHLKILEKYFQVHHKKLGSSVYIPYAYQEAIKQGTRYYTDGKGAEHDLNRKFKYDKSKGGTPLSQLAFPKARQLWGLIGGFGSLEYMFSFHGDNYPKTKKLSKNNQIVDTDNGFYIYHHSKGNGKPATRNGDEEGIIKKHLFSLFAVLKHERIRLLTGWDDIEDKALGHYFKEGYTRITTEKPMDGSLEHYAVHMGEIGKAEFRHAFCFEIPGWINHADRETLIKLIFLKFILPIMHDITISHPLFRLTEILNQV